MHPLYIWVVIFPWIFMIVSCRMSSGDSTHFLWSQPEVMKGFTCLHLKDFISVWMFWLWYCYLKIHLGIFNISSHFFLGLWSFYIWSRLSAVTDVFSIWHTVFVLSFKSLYYIYYIYLCMVGAYMLWGLYMEVRRQLVGIGSFLPPCGSWGLNSDLQS